MTCFPAANDRASLAARLPPIFRVGATFTITVGSVGNAGRIGGRGNSTPNGDVGDQNRRAEPAPAPRGHVAPTSMPRTPVQTLDDTL